MSTYLQYNWIKFLNPSDFWLRKNTKDLYWSNCIVEFQITMYMEKVLTVPQGYINWLDSKYNKLLKIFSN